MSFQAFFVHIDDWAQTHENLGAAMQMLMSVCTDDLVVMLREQLLLINRQWKDTTESAQGFKHDDSIKKKRDEFTAARTNVLETLERIDRELQEPLPCSAKALKEQENRLFVRSTNPFARCILSLTYFLESSIRLEYAQ